MWWSSLDHPPSPSGPSLHSASELQLRHISVPSTEKSAQLAPPPQAAQLPVPPELPLAPAPPLPLPLPLPLSLPPPPPLPSAPNGVDVCGRPYLLSLEDLLTDHSALLAAAPALPLYDESSARQLGIAPLFTLHRYSLLSSLSGFAPAAAAALAAVPGLRQATLQRGRPLRLLLLSGSSAFWGFNGNARTAVYGEILQWSDLFTALLHLNASLTFVHSEEDCEGSSVSGCPCHGSSEYALHYLHLYDALFVDYLGLKWLEGRSAGGRQGLRQRLGARRIWLLDSFGTSPQANALSQAAGEAAGIGLYCCEQLELAQVLTLGPSTHNTFLGSMVFKPAPQQLAALALQSQPDTDDSGGDAGLLLAVASASAASAAAASPPLPPLPPEFTALLLQPPPRPRLLLLHGKQCHFLPPPSDPLGAALRSTLAAFQAAGFTAIDTMLWTSCSPTHRPPGLLSAGVLPPASLRRLQASSHVLLGLGRPYLGAQVLEALADGMHVALPAYAQARNCSNDAELAGKPVCEQWGCQHPGVQGLEGVSLFDAGDEGGVRALAQGLAAQPEGYFGGSRALPRGYAPGDFLATVAGILESIPV